MKKFLTIIAILAVIFFIILQVFMWYNKNNIMSNQAVFKIYLDVKDEDMDEYFGVEKGTYNKDKHMIVCDLPVNAAAFKPHSQIVNRNIGEISCDEKYNPEMHDKYDQTELTDGGSMTLIILDNSSSVPVQMVNENLGGASIVAKRQVYFDYGKGMINHIVLAKDKIYDYCNK